MTATEYKYTVLDESTGEIRIFLLLPGTFEQPVQGLLLSYPFNEQTRPKFEALSYSWGPPNDPIDIYLRTTNTTTLAQDLKNPNGSSVTTSGGKRGFFSGGKKLSQILKSNKTPKTPEVLPGESSSRPPAGFTKLAVTRNLGRALPYLRYTDKPRSLWIDAICVNQQDVMERSKQVKRMAELYTKTDRVVVWLGEASSNSQSAFNNLKLVSSKIDWNIGMGTMSPASNNPLDAHWADPLETNPFTHDAMLSLHDLLHREWFERLWIWQEIQLANDDAILQCGKEVIAWPDFRKALRCLNEKPVGEPCEGDLEGFAIAMARAVKICSHAEGIVFGDLCQATKLSNCTDPRDRVYALLSLLRDSDVKGIQPDYTKTKEQVYQEAATLVFQNTCSFQSLSLCEWHSRRGKVPSWVPDLSTPLKVAKFSLPSLRHSSLTTVSIFRDILRAQGVIVAHIKTLWHNDIPDKITSLEKVASITLDLGSNFDLEENYLCGGKVSEAVCRSMVAGHFDKRMFPSDISCPPEAICVDYFGQLNRALHSENQDLQSFNRYLSHASDKLQSRALFHSHEGYIGLGPTMARPGDCVTLIVGCPMPMILRPQINGKYLVIGEAYCDGIMNGEPFLGPLPPDVDCVWQVGEDSISWPAFRNRRTGELQPEDPRLEALPQEWRRDSHSRDHLFTMFANSRTGEDRFSNLWDPRTTPEELVKRGVKLQDFDIM